jgi:general secretion pathway protein G
MTRFSDLQAFRAGFSLIEIMLVVLIIGILATVATTGMVRHAEMARINATKANIEALQLAVGSYELIIGKRPPTLEELVKEGDADWPGPFLDEEAVPNDAWERPFKYFMKGKRVKIKSAGSDGIFDTEDDVTN